MEELEDSTLPKGVYRDFPVQNEWVNVPDNTRLSFGKELKNKLVLVDFWTSCCINCIHVLADLHELENKFANKTEIVFLGCHSGKFANEKHVLRESVSKYGIEHAVVNDNKMAIWKQYGVRVWPTLILFSPRTPGKIIAVLTGEGHKEDFSTLLTYGAAFYKKDVNKDPI